MKYVIDACNLIFHDTKLYETLDGQGFQAARALLVGRLAAFAKLERLESILAVFDGSEKAAHRSREEREAGGRVTLVYADPRSEADRYIIDLVDSAQRPGELTVVTNDKFITREVTRARGRIVSCAEFLKRMKEAERRSRRDPFAGEDPRKYAGLSPHEVDEWMKLFDFKDDE
ncbi:MAG: NYN domain-containing protein [Planctomycetota bacterium]|nr:NYN domain-containing protein [Planctomycetota bacterium]